MRPIRLSLLLLSALVLSQTVVWGVEKPQSDKENAALSYWQAFAMIPEASGENDKILSEWDTVELDDKALQVIEQGSGALDLLHRGAGIGVCYWGSALEEGPGTMLPHLSKARQLARLACLRARYRFEKGQSMAGWEDVHDSLVLARHTGGEQLLISVLIQFAIERMAIAAVATHLPDFAASDLQAVKADIDSLPPPSTIAQGIECERKWMFGWLRDQMAQSQQKQGVARTAFIEQLVGDDSADARQAIEALLNAPDELKQILDEVDAYYDEMLGLFEQPPSDRDVAVKDLNKRLENSQNAIARLLLPGVNGCMRAGQQATVKFALFMAALDILQNGSDRLTQHRDPAGDGPFELRETPGGFELRSQLIHQEKPLTLQIGAGTEEDTKRAKTAEPSNT